MCESQHSANIYACINARMHVDRLYVYIHTCIYKRYTYTHKTFSRPKKTSRPDRKFFIGMATGSGLNIKRCRTPMLITRAQCGGQNFSRFHVDERLFRQLEPMADAAMPLAKPCHQVSFWKFHCVSTYRCFSSTGSLCSGISCLPVRRSTRMLVANTPLLPRAHAPLVFLQTRTKQKSENTLNGSVFHLCFSSRISSLHLLSSNAQTHKPSTP